MPLPEKTPPTPQPVVLPSAYLAPAEWWVMAYGQREVWENTDEYYEKQTFRSRCLIATAQGVQALSIPIEHTGAKQLMRDVRLSSHGQWQRVHWNALRTAYRHSPFYEFLADDLAPVYARKFTFLVDFNAALREVVAQLLGFDVQFRTAPDCRQKDMFPWEGIHVPEYWQTFRDRTGFLPGLGIVDLLFHLGSESRLILREARQSLRLVAPMC